MEQDNRLLRRHIEPLAAAEIEAGQHVVHPGHVGAGLLEFFVVFGGQPGGSLVLLHPFDPADGEVVFFAAVGTGVGGWLGFLGLVVKNAVGAAASPAATTLLTTALLVSTLLLAPARTAASALVAGTAATVATSVSAAASRAAFAASVSAAASGAATTTTTASPASATSSVIVHVSSACHYRVVGHP